MRQLKFHEKKLLKKVNFLTWKTEHNHREAEVMRRYHLGDRDGIVPSVHFFSHPPRVRHDPRKRAQVATRD
jgi:hypothetical protein